MAPLPWGTQPTGTAIAELGSYNDWAFSLYPVSNYKAYKVLIDLLFLTAMLKGVQTTYVREL